MRKNIINFILATQLAFMPLAQTHADSWANESAASAATPSSAAVAAASSPNSQQQSSEPETAQTVSTTVDQIVQLRSKVNKFISEYNNKYPATVFDSNAMKLIIENDMTSVEEIEQKQDALLSKMAKVETLSELEKVNKAIIDNPLEAQATEIAKLTFRYLDVESTGEFIKYLFVRMIENDSEKRALFFLLDKFEKIKLNNNYRQQINAHQSWLSNSANDGMIATVALVLTYPLLKTTAQRYPYLQKGWEYLKSIAKTQYSKWFSKNGTNKGDIVDETMRAADDRLLLTYNNKPAAQAQASEFIDNNSQVTVEEFLRRLNSMKADDIKKAAGAREYLPALRTDDSYKSAILAAYKSSFRSLVGRSLKDAEYRKQLYKFMALMVGGPAALGGAETVAYKNDFLFFKDHYLLPGEELERTSRGLLTLKYGCDTSSFLQEMSNRNYVQDDKESSARDLRQLNDLIEQYLNIKMTNMLYSQVRSVAKKQTFDNGNAEYIVDAVSGKVSFTRNYKFSNQLEISFDCPKYANGQNGANQSELLVSLAESKKNLKLAANQISKARFMQALHLRIIKLKELNAPEAKDEEMAQALKKQNDALAQFSFANSDLASIPKEWRDSMNQLAASLLKLNATTHQLIVAQITKEIMLGDKRLEIFMKALDVKMSEDPLSRSALKALPSTAYNNGNWNVEKIYIPESE